MKHPQPVALALGLVLALPALSQPPEQRAECAQQARLLARSVLPADTFRAGSPATGAFFTDAERAAARANGIPGPDAGPYFPSQPVQGFSSMIPAEGGTWWALSDNGFASRDSSADQQLPLYRIDLAGIPDGGHVSKSLLLDLLAIPDPAGVGGDGDFFRMPFYTIESVHVVDGRTLLVACDNNFHFSHGRARSRSADRNGPLAADDTEMILVRLGTPLGADPRLLPPGPPRPGKRTWRTTG